MRFISRPNPKVTVMIYRRLAIVPEKQPTA